MIYHQSSPTVFLDKQREQSPDEKYHYNTEGCKTLPDGQRKSVHTYRQLLLSEIKGCWA